MMEEGKQGVMMKRTAHEEGEKEAKKQKLLEQLGARCIPYLTPNDENFSQLWKYKYHKFIIQKAEHTPVDLHSIVQKAFLALLQHGCLFQDLVRLKGKDLLTPVSRILIGCPGYTYKYLNTRLFAVPWADDQLNIKYSTDTLSEACRAFYELNKYLYSQTVCELHKLNGSRQDHGFPDSNAETEFSLPSCSAKESEEYQTESYNVTLINYLDPRDMPYLREEPYFGMGKMAVSWHHDENLVQQSTVAVYNYSFQDNTATKYVEDKDASKWCIGLKIAWDIETPGFVFPLNSGDSYYMLDDLNKTHQHCVLSGSDPRFSSTHRVAECSRGTLQYIQSRCHMALENLFINPKNEKAELKSLETMVLMQAEEIHNEVEFEWLRQYWFQGKRYLKCSDFWSIPLAELEDYWKQMEITTSLVLEEIVKEKWTKKEKCKILKCIMPSLKERRDLRQEWRERCCCKLAKTLPRDEAPVCRPHWTDEDTSMPLPFDLSSIISKLESLMED
ncbi:alpha-ketoglutarate-dependent dioxygenase FTO [Pelobates fuscus]|uniref:alpha-ketoglutarate-dependent dioxygenase FTO n=1 Tax=Pelobates fuscus TaxID=191477 RepID=UPI002FE43A93